MRWRIAWVAAFALAIAGAVLYVAVQSDAMWWVGILMGVPLLLLAFIRAERLGDDARAPGPEGPWGAP